MLSGDPRLPQMPKDEHGLRRFRRQHILDPVSRLEQIFHHRVKPGLAFAPGRDRGVDADDIG